MNITMPISLGPDEVWLFVEPDCDCGQCVNAARIAFTGWRFIALPTEVFNTEGLFPSYRNDDEEIAGLTWATTTDITANLHIFGNPG